MSCAQTPSVTRGLVERGRLVSQHAIGPDLLVMTVEAPVVAQSALPGQFVHVAVGEARLRRPFSVYRASDGQFEILYRVKGAGTRRMAGWLPGAQIDLVGPLGKGFTPRLPDERVLLVGGGIGVAPLAFFGDCEPGGGLAVLGFRSVEEVCASDRLESAGYPVVVTTVDGSFGQMGLVVDPLGAAGVDLGRIDRVLTCGPWPMMAAVAGWAREQGLPCEAALEKEMGCGIGACLGCVVETTDPDRPFARVCTEGPVMDARGVRWNH